MNAYELAKVTLDAGCAERSCACYSPQFGDTDGVAYYPETVVRQQADLIAELKKKVKPIALLSPNKAGIYFYDENIKPKVSEHLAHWMVNWIPLYTTPQIKPLKCIVKDCENHRNEGGFTGDLCNPCHEFITTGNGKYSQAYRNTQTKQRLSDEEITAIRDSCYVQSGIDEWEFDDVVFARAIEERHGIK